MTRGLADSSSTWTPISREPTYLQVARQIETQVLAGHLRAGEKLPSERQLSEQLGVSRTSVREALRVMEALEIVRVRPGTGPDSGSVVVGKPGDAIASILRIHVALQHFDDREIAEGRVAIEAETARLAAMRATEDDIASLRDVLRRMEENVLSPDQFHELDTEFHVTVAAASRSSFLQFLMSSIREAVSYTMLVAFREADDWQRVGPRLIKSHVVLLDCIIAGDPDRAEEAIRRHVGAFQRSMSSRQTSLTMPSS